MQLLQRLRDFAKQHTVFTTYLTISLLIAVVLLIDPLFNRPSGLITSSLFTGKPTDHGDASPCAFDYEGSWQIGLVQGASPLALQVSNESVISCRTIGNQTAASYVAEPFLVIPPWQGEGVHSAAQSQTHWHSTHRCLDRQCVPTPLLAAGGVSTARWYAFYQLKNLHRGKGEIGVAMSTDLGKSWTHLGTALSADYPLSSPFVTFDEDSDQYVMIPDTHRSRQHTVELYVTSKADFPFGWRFNQTALQGAHYMDTTATRYQGQWWIFTTVRPQAAHRARHAHARARRKNRQ